MRGHIDLGRSFSELTNSELDSPETLASLNEFRHGGHGWPALLQERRVVLLAEAGSGKTWEMEQQARQLGEVGFFVALEVLDRESLGDALLGDAQKLANWLKDGVSEGWFFLDARDELLLTEGKLDRALRRFAKSIDGHLGRAHIIVSSRPLDWRPEIDTASIATALPIPPIVQTPALADDAFMHVLRREFGPSTTPTSDFDSETKGGIRTVVLLPLSDRQIRQFAENSGVADPGAFMEEIAKQDAWTFARRPLDLTELIAAWTSSGSLGTRAQQHEANIRTKLKDDPERRDRGVLSDERAIEGAERLALALALTRTRTLRSPDQTLDAARAEGVLDPATILTEWSLEERQTLLRRALFDPATYGRVRFHHRSVQEYLAARHLWKLRQAGMSIKSIFRLLFGERYQTKVVLPSMKPIAAWLALWDDPVRRELISREPEALLSLGDPESLDHHARAAVLRAFVAMYHGGSWRGLNIEHDSVRRLADPLLALTVRELWNEKPTSPDVLELLGEIIWQGKLVACGDIADQIARDPTAEYYRRVIAVRALLDCGLDQAARNIAESILQEPGAWPDKAVFSLAADLYPCALSVAELILLFQRTPEPNSTTGGFGWVLRDICRRVDASSEEAIALRRALAAQIWNGRIEPAEIYQLKSSADHLAPALLILCHRQIDAGFAEAELIHDVVIAARFGKHDRTDDTDIAAMRVHFAKALEQRPKLFWAELDFADSICPEKDAWTRLHNVEHYGLIGTPTENDPSWLLETLRIEGDGRRPVALFALLHLWARDGRPEGGLEVLKLAVADDSELSAIILDWAKPPEIDPRHRRWERQSKKRKCIAQAREQQRLERWKVWRSQLLADPDTAFGMEKRAVTLNNLYHWLRAAGGQTGRYNVWNTVRLTEAFGADIAQRTAEAMRCEWRNSSLALWSEKLADQRNTTTHKSIMELCGLAAESQIAGWASKLTPDQARLATRYSMLELNGFSPFILDLIQAQPKEVEEVIGTEIIAELSVGEDHNHLPILQDVSYSHIDLKRLIAPRLLAALVEGPLSFSQNAEANWAAHVDRVLSILDQATIGEDRLRVGAECARRFEDDPRGAVALTWLRGIFRFDPERGTQVLVAALATPDPSTQERAISTFAALFGDRDGLGNEAVAPPIQARSLGQLIRAAYRFVRVQDDVVHDGVYSPDLRDKAETARGFLLAKLLDTPGQEARQVLLELADEPDLEHFPDRLRLLARQRAAMDAEFEPFDTAAVVALETRYEAPPSDRDGLFQVMIDRLGDLAHDIAHHEFTDRTTLRTIHDEVEMQRTLALRLSALANGAFDVTREPETADLKKTDIRLAAVVADHQAAIEIKLIDKRWSLSDLEHALRHQLVGQYLRHNRCRAGCLLLTYDGTRSYWLHPTTSQRLILPEMQAYLESVARSLEIENEGQIRLAIFLLDLTDPPLVPAHR